MLAGEGVGGGLIHLVAAFDTDAAYVGEGGGDGQACRAGDERDFRSAACTVLGQGKAHLAAGVVADVAHGVDFLIRRSGCYHNVLAQKVFLLEIVVEAGYYVFRFFHASLAFKS